MNCQRAMPSSYAAKKQRKDNSKENEIQNEITKKVIIEHTNKHEKE